MYLVLESVKNKLFASPLVYCSWIDYEKGKCCFVENTNIVTFSDHSLTLIIKVV